MPILSDADSHTMTPYSFLAALPALLALAGFVVYQLVGTNRSGDEITRRIVDKLRKNAPTKLTEDKRFSGSQLERLLLADQELHKVVGEQDFLLLKQALHQQFIISLTVYSLAVLFCALSAFLFVRQVQAKKEFRIDHISFASTEPQSGGIPVDTDLLQISWQSSGEPEDATAYLENVQTHAKTDVVVVPASEHTIRFQSASYKAILTNRHRGDSNRIRLVLQSKLTVFASDVIDLPVGLTVLTVVDSTAQLTVAAMIDNSRIPNYDFEAKIAIPPRTSSGRFVSVGPSISYRFKPQTIPNAKQVDWPSAKGVYLGPDDPRLVRFRFLIDSSLNP
jgi:hypothetical protein